MNLYTGMEKEKTGPNTKNYTSYEFFFIYWSIYFEDIEMFILIII